MRPGQLVIPTLAAALIGCGSGGDSTPPDAGSDLPADATSDGLPDAGGAADAAAIAADAGLVSPVGSRDRIDVATWNIENFPTGDFRNPRGEEAAAETVELTAEIIRSLEIDVVAVQEIADEAAWSQLMDRLPGYGDVLSAHEYGDGDYQKIGFIYREDLVDVAFVDLLFTDSAPACENTFLHPFPRPPLEVGFRVVDNGFEIFDFTAIAVHLKAGQPDGCGDCEARRDCANRHLEEYVRTEVDDEDAVVLGDFNEILYNDAANDPFARWPSGGYNIRSRPLADDGDYSFVGAEVLLDHVITTIGFEAELFGDSAQVVHLDDELTSYADRVSDHLPVVVSFDPTP